MFTPIFRNISDQNIWREVFTENEYQLSVFSANDVILDVGAHIGAFTCATLARGARRIVAFEPDPSSYALATQNTDNYLRSCGIDASVSVRNCAVWRSDKDETVRLTNAQFSAYHQGLFFAGQSTLFSDADTVPVRSIKLDTILNAYPEVALLKLDCEGAEWPIIFTSRELHKVTRLVLELHSLVWKAAESAREVSANLFAEFGHYTLEDLKTHVERLGMVCTWEQINRNYLNDPDFYLGLVSFEHSQGRATK